MWDTGTEKKGGALKPRGKLPAELAVAAFGVYFKMQEGALSARIARDPTITGRGMSALRDLPPEQRFTVLRLGLNAGAGFGNRLFERISKGGDIQRTGKTTRDPDNAGRTAVLHMARAMHIGQAIFGIPASFYAPPPGHISNKAASELFNLPGIKHLPDNIVPITY